MLLWEPAVPSPLLFFTSLQESAVMMLSCTSNVLRLTSFFCQSCKWYGDLSSKVEWITTMTCLLRLRCKAIVTQRIMCSRSSYTTKSLCTSATCIRHLLTKSAFHTRRRPVTKCSPIQMRQLQPQCDLPLGSAALIILPGPVTGNN